MKIVDVNYKDANGWRAVLSAHTRRKGQLKSLVGVGGERAPDLTNSWQTIWEASSGQQPDTLAQYTRTIAAGAAVYFDNGGMRVKSLTDIQYLYWSYINTFEDDAVFAMEVEVKCLAGDEAYQAKFAYGSISARHYGGRIDVGFHEQKILIGAYGGSFIEVPVDMITDFVKILLVKQSNKAKVWVNDKLVFFTDKLQLPAQGRQVYIGDGSGNTSWVGRHVLKTIKVTRAADYVFEEGLPNIGVITLSSSGIYLHGAGYATNTYASQPYFQAYSKNYQWAKALCSTTLDLTNYNKLTYTAMTSHEIGCSGPQAKVFLCADGAGWVETKTDYLPITDSLVTYTRTIDVSDLTGLYKIGVGAYSTDSSDMANAFLSRATDSIKLHY